MNEGIAATHVYQNLTTPMHKIVLVGIRRKQVEESV